MFAHCVESTLLAHKLQTWKGATTNQGAVAYELGEMLIFPLVDARLQNTQSHWLLDDIVVVWDIALVNTAMEQPRRVMATV